MDSSPEFQLECAVGSVRQYAREHNLSAEQFKALFDCGVGCAVALGVFGLGDQPQTPEQGVTVTLEKIDRYASLARLTGADVERLFNAGLSAAGVLLRKQVA